MPGPESASAVYSQVPLLLCRLLPDESLGTFILATDPDDMTKLGARFENY